MSHFLRFGLVAIIAVLDQITKIWADSTLAMYEQIPVTGFFNITKAYNYGAAFSFLDNEGGWQRWFFTIVSLVVSIVLCVWLYRMQRAERWLSLAISLILGGAIGNLIDRAWHGYVVDFIQVYWQTSYFPSFNIADAAISCGTVLLLGLTLFQKDGPATESADTDKPAS
ncbi:signal peptidase II [Granulosicoccus antarcticus]|uniref:Lipoprotein signal peptidase n=1 Tax=Granulosicoccus antarcticus IMCC3135 TaxID=1192854 RepID=A0A2Z2NGN5_9GAMM|nr:signal peptidase II [Granulosicoccus antarcticus]ASJ70446.1 Lipoprotein signal peptidase [Granulosicoccus antarcticus IMCC3135]